MVASVLEEPAATCFKIRVEVTVMPFFVDYITSDVIDVNSLRPV
jgi:hypothetical protein